MEQIFLELGIAIIAATILAILLYQIKQPTIISYLLAGIIVGPSVFNLVNQSSAFEAFAEIGIAFLLFIVGLNLDFNTLKEVGEASLIVGFSQVILITLLGFLIGYFALGFSVLASVYIGIIIAFSSTIIIVKLLSDKKDIETLYGKLSIGLLLVQDIIAIFVLMLISATRNETELAPLILGTVSKLIGVMIGLYLITQYVLPKLIDHIAKSQELLFLFSISWAFFLAFLMSVTGFSIEIGALFAGIMLASSGYHFEISSKIRSLRDFFIALFFISLGSRLAFTTFSSALFPAILLSITILIAKPLLVMVFLGMIGYKKRTGFLVGSAMGQLSEFSLILVLLGVSFGHVPDILLSIMTLTAIITISFSTYLINYNNQIYSTFSQYLNLFEKQFPVREEKYKFNDKSSTYEIVLFGYNRIGYSLLKTFNKLKKKILVVDFNPDITKKLAKQNVESIYGDASDTELLEELNLDRASMVISTIPDLMTNLTIIEKARQINKKCIIIMTAHQIDDGISLYDKGADYVIMPHFLGGEHISTIIEEFGLDMGKFVEQKLRHITDLKLRKEAGHDHPTRESHGK